MTFIPLYSLDVGNRDLGITKSRSLISNIIMAKTLACSEEVWFSIYLKKFKRHLREQRDPQTAFRLWSTGPFSSIKYSYSGRKSVKAENESSFIILHPCQHQHICSLQKALAPWLDVWCITHMGGRQPSSHAASAENAFS